MPRVQRKSAMKVQGGRVLRKNNWKRDRDDLWIPRASEIRLVREDPGYGLRHLVTVPQLRAFLERLPMWDEVAVGLRAVVLSGDDHAMGWHQGGVIALCGWERELWWDDAAPEWLAKNEHVLDCLGVEREGTEVRWTEAQARAFQLLDVLPHELGHHRDRMTTRSKWDAARGEPYAERYAREVFDRLWPAYDLA
jgi:hypothetical protein